MSETPDHVIQSTREWREQQAMRRSKAEEKSKQQANGHAEPLPTVVAATLAGKQQPRQFLDSAHFFPLRNVVLMQGDGGVGKSLLILQLAIACTTGTQWLGMEVAQGPVVYFSAEEDIGELTNRLNEICQAEGIDASETYQLHLLPMAGEDTVLAAEQKGLLCPTALFARLEATLESIAPVAVVLDNLANVFAGNENNRTLANHFISLLRRLTLNQDCVLFLIGHPSLAGLASGSGTSGSTGWGNSVRVRPYLYRPDGPDADANDRVFEIKKANYAVTGTKLHLKWVKGRFVRSEPVNPLDAVKKAGDVDRIKDMFACGRWRHDERSPDWGGYAVAEVIDRDVGRGLAAPERSPEQGKNRTTVRRLLSIWLASGAIILADAVDAHRRATKVFMPGKGEQ
jgi:RecA-family ATPase